MQFIDLGFQQQRIHDEIEARIRTVLKHGQYIMGPEVRELEEQLAAYVGVKHAVACSSGTDALLMALMAYGVGPGDAIFTSPFTFIATAEVISLLGAVPVFVDIDPETYNLSPRALAEAIAALDQGNAARYPLPRMAGDSRRLPVPLKPRGIIAVDLYGLPANYDEINAIAREHNLFVIEDGAQSFGGEIRGTRMGSLSEVGCTSFFPAKPLGCYGDGGMCFTPDDSLAERMRSISLHGKGHHKYENVRIGVNGRLDTLQAAILLAKFKIFPDEVELRQTVARSYNDLIASGASVVAPCVPAGWKSVWAQYTVRAKDAEHRATLQKRLGQAGIPTAVYYPKPLHLQHAFAPLGYRTGDFPVSEDYADRVFSLPMHPYLKPEEVQSIGRRLLNEVA